MKSFVVRKAPCLKGTISVPGDKSIAHRAVILSALAEGRTLIKNFPSNNDCLATIAAFKKLGIKIAVKNNISVYGKGLHGLTAPRSPIFVGESGTTFRLLLGVLAGAKIKARLTAGKSLSIRPMRRVTEPLRSMGARIAAFCPKAHTNREEYPPIILKGAELHPVTYKMAVASAQVKSAVLLAGLYLKGRTRVIEPVPTRDHTERMLSLFKAEVRSKRNVITLSGGRKLVSPKEIVVPGDISSASFFIVGALLIDNAKVILKQVSLNPSRIGIIKVLMRMGANLALHKVRPQAAGSEPVGDILVRTSKLKATIVKKEEIPSLIDELPILMVAACFAKGNSVFEGVEELRVKETDRIRSMCDNLSAMGASVKALKTGASEKIVVEGPAQLSGAAVRSFGDHRTAMSMVIAGMNAQGETIIDDISCISKSFPEFLKKLNSLICK